MAAPKLHFELDYLDDVPTPPGAFSNHAAFKLLERMLQPQRHLSIEDAGEKIVDMCLPTGTGSYPSAGSTGALGTMLCALAQQIPYDHPSHFKLVRLVTYLSTVTRMRKDQNEKPYRFHMDLGEVDMRLRGYWEPFFDDDPETPNQYVEYLNFTGFLARLTGAHHDKDAMLAVRSMREALEEENEHTETFCCLVSASALWILFCGQRLFVETVQLPMPISPEDNFFKPGPLFSGPMFGLERWEFWQEAFVAVPDKKGASDECKRLAEKAADLMVAIQGNMTL